MQVIVCCHTEHKEELLLSGLSPSASVIYVEQIEEVLQLPDAEAVIDLLFENKPQRIHLLQQVGKTILINSVIRPLTEIDSSFIRINAWPTFLRSSLIEASCLTEQLKDKGREILALFNKQPEWLPDQHGFIRPRIISMIINEAHFALSENVSTKEEIDTAMKLGTAYPYGPFEWAQKIGLKKIAALLEYMSGIDERYSPSERLLKEAFGPKTV